VGGAKSQNAITDARAKLQRMKEVDKKHFLERDYKINASAIHNQRVSMRQRSQSTKKYRPSAAKRLNGRRAPGSSEESTHKVGRHGRSIAFCDRT